MFFFSPFFSTVFVSVSHFYDDWMRFAVVALIFLSSTFTRCLIRVLFLFLSRPPVFLFHRPPSSTLPFSAAHWPWRSTNQGGPDYWVCLTEFFFLFSRCLQRGRIDKMMRFHFKKKRQKFQRISLPFTEFFFVLFWCPLARNDSINDAIVFGHFLKKFK